MRRCARFVVFRFLPFLFFAFVNAALGRRSPAGRHHPECRLFRLRPSGPSRTSRSISARRSCLGDQPCRAFTYNTKAKWCFLKSDFAVIKPFNGAVAGKVVNISGDPDIGAPPELAFFPAWMADEAASMRVRLTNGSVAVGEQGLVGADRGRRPARLPTGDPRTAVQNFTTAVATSPDDGALWLKLARAVLAVQALNSQETATLQSDATSAAFNAYSSCAPPPARADALAVIAAGLDRRDLFRPALQAYEASLALVNSASVRAEYEDLKARKGFRVVEHTVDADTPSPRVCAQFSEDLVKAGVDYAPFVTVDEAPPKSVEAQGRQICVEGLEHGRHYRVTFRPGLPAAIGEVLEAPGGAVDLHPGPRRLGPLHRRQLRAARDRAARHPGRHRQHGRRRHEALPHRRPLAGPASFRLPVPAPARRLRHRATSPTRWARRSGRASSTSPTSSTRKSPPASRSTRRCPTASPASMC